MDLDPNNKPFQAARMLLEETRDAVFLTGRAGTGKTTFLRRLNAEPPKPMAVVAPTGVAAINARGMTIHSFFQIPPSVYPPNDQRLQRQAPSSGKNRTNIFRHFRISKQRKEVFQKMELLVIDEISMVRCDLLDVIDRLLRTFGGDPYRPFGGKQVLFIGDAFQLPPVTPPEEWNILRPHYESPYFFSAHAWRDANPRLIELQKIYRQRDQRFIDLLNRVREGRPQTADVQLLNERYEPRFDYAGEQYIFLGTRNRDVDRRNATELKKVEAPLFTSIAAVSGDFDERDMPTAVELQLKKGAQVMFVKNDTGEGRRYFNGKIGRITDLLPEDRQIIVQCPEDKEPITVERAEWKKIRYEWDEEEKCIQEIEIGRFEQFPLKLAWAITVHKSQGLTFERVYASLGNAFAAGQVYVALSRCTSLSGLKLASKISETDIFASGEVRSFTEKFLADEAIDRLLDGVAFDALADKVREALALPDYAAAVQALWLLKTECPEMAHRIQPLEDELMTKLASLGKGENDRNEDRS